MKQFKFDNDLNLIRLLNNRNINGSLVFNQKLNGEILKRLLLSVSPLISYKCIRFYFILLIYF